MFDKECCIAYNYYTKSITGEMNMQATIDTIREAQVAVMRAIHQAIRVFGDDPEISVLRIHLQKAGVSLREAENQAVRIKSRRDLEAQDHRPGEDAA